MHAVIIGATGGLGTALTRHLAAHPMIKMVHALSRSGETAAVASVRPGRIDLLDETSITAAATDIATYGAPDLILVASGILSDGEGLRPEKSLRQQSPEAFERVFAINTIGPALVAKHLLPIQPRTGRSVFAALSARVGSISDNRLGGWHAYRASKAALNMLIRNYALEQARRNAESVVVGLHPGTVDTGLSKPFHAGLPAGQLFTPDTAATHLLAVIDGLAPCDSGKVFDWAGTEIPA